MLASEIKVCRPRAGGEPGAMLASEKQERSSLNETQSGWIAPSSAREWIDRSGARCMEIPERCSRVDKQERCSLCGNPEIYSRMETVERSSQVGREHKFATIQVIHRLYLQWLTNTRGTISVDSVGFGPTSEAHISSSS